VTLVLEADRAVLFNGDCLEGLKLLPDDSLDSLCCDPPCGIGFMGHSWDTDKGGQELPPGLGPWLAGLADGESNFDIHKQRRESGDYYYCRFEISLRADDAGAPIPEGTGTALKPAAEFWWLVRKPFKGTVGKCFAEHGTGILNIDECRIGTEEMPVTEYTGEVVSQNASMTGANYGRERVGTVTGRYPANVTLDEEAAQALDTQEGRDVSRFFYCAKAGAGTNRDEGMPEDFKVTSASEMLGRKEGSAGMDNPRAGAGRGGAKNSHPTVKHTSLMDWLVRLITPPGGTVLDPFTGSGTTGYAAIFAGRSFFGCELSPEYADIARCRIEHALKETTK
jgi:site-specific DNA-methyltransferase (adenine-specific)